MTTITIPADLGTNGYFTAYKDGAAFEFPTGIEIKVADWVAERVEQQRNHGYAEATSVIEAGIRAVDRNPTTDVIEVKRGTDRKGYVPPYVLPVASAALGGVKASARTPEADTVEAKIGEDNKLYVAPYTLPAAVAATLGGVMAAAKGETDTVPAKIGTDNILYVPTYPAEYTLPAATDEVLGGVKLAANVAASTESTSPTTAEFNAVLTALKAAGIMEADSET